MKERHIALVIEDDKETAEDVVEILLSIDCNSVVVDNRADALIELQNKPFCLILLDLQIKSAADSIKGHVEHGRALLRNIRERHGEHTGAAFWLPVLVLSGFAREVSEAVEVMKDGASDVIQKPLDRQQVSERIRRALQASGRQEHEHCHEQPSPQRLNLKEEIVIAIPGDRIGRRTRVTIASKPVQLTDNSLKVLLRLMIGKQKGDLVHKHDLGAAEDQGFKGISILRNELKGVLGNVDIVKNHYHGNYSLESNVIIGECAVDKLLQIDDKTISVLAKLLQHHPPVIPGKSEGNSEEFPTHRHRRQE